MACSKFMRLLFSLEQGVGLTNKKLAFEYFIPTVALEFPILLFHYQSNVFCLLMDKPHTRVAEVQTIPHFTSFLLIESSIHRQTGPIIVLSVIL